MRLSQINPREAIKRLNPDVPELRGVVAPLPMPASLSAVQSEDEDELREEIRKEIVRRGWAVFCGATNGRSRRTVGEPDMCICAGGGRVFFVELKTKTGKLSPAQQAVHHQLHALGHNPLVIRSLKDFLEAVK